MSTPYEGLEEAKGQFLVQELFQFCPVCGCETEHRRWIRMSFCLVCSENRHTAAVQAEMRQEQERRTHKQQELVRHTGVDEVIMRTALTLAPDSLRTFLKENNFYEHITSGHNLIFLGGVGTGKTTLAVGVAMQALSCGFKAHYVKAYELIESGGVYPFCHFLIIDEIERGVRFFGNQPCDEDQLVLFRILEARKNSKLSTMALSNHSGVELAKRLGEATYDRLRHNALGLTFAQKSFRKPLSL